MATLDSRTDLFISFLRQQKLRGWLSWRPDELILQLGHYPHWGLSFLLFLSDGERTLFVPELEPPTGLSTDIRIITYPWGDIQCADPFSILNSSLQAALDRYRIARTDIGFLRSPGRSSLAAVFAEEPSLSGDEISKLTHGMTDRSSLGTKFSSLYLHKTDEEIERIRLANKVALTGLNAWRSALTPGTTEAEAAAEAEYAVLSQTGQNGIYTARAWAMVQSGPNTANSGRFNRSSGRRLESGDLVLIEMATCVNGYWSDLTRTEPVGEPASFAADLLHAVGESQKVAIQALHPGVSARDVDAEARQTLRKAGFADYFTHALGHHVGFRYHDPGFLIAPGVSDVLQPGMVITIEPGAYVPDMLVGARLEDNIAINDRGVDILSATVESESHDQH
ncbi:MAG: Xaa-Pro peptidase family protein [Silvibacterium sp.]